MLVRVEHHPLGPRLHIHRWRWHHWHTGVMLIAWGFRWVWVDRNDLRHTIRPGFDPEIGWTTTTEDIW